MIDISVLVINYREAAKTRQSVESLLKSTDVSIEVFLLDNSCDEAEAAALAQIDDSRVRLHISDTNLGVTGGYNLALEHICGRYLFIINNDALIVEPSGLAQMARYLDDHPEVAAIQPKILSIHDQRKFDYAGAGGGYLDKYGYPFCRGRLFQTLEEDSGQYEEIVDITWASGCALFVNKQLLIDMGGFDPIYFAYAEEVDISLAIWRYGYHVRSFPGIQVVHHGAWSWDKQKPMKIKLIHRNHLILFLKWYTLSEILRRLPMRMFLEVASLLFYTVNGEPGLVWSVLRANFEVVWLLPYIVRSRYRIRGDGKPPGAPLYNRSVVLSYYIKGIRSFKNLSSKHFCRKITRHEFIDHTVETRQSQTPDQSSVASEECLKGDG